MGTAKLTRLGQMGFTLIELVIVIVTLAIVAAVAIPKYADMAESARVNATKKEMTELKHALVGNPSAIAGGEYVDRGFEGDVGFAPSSLTDLAVRPGSLAVYDPITRLGWNGPYIDSSGGDYLKDAWGNNYSYQPSGRLIVSTGGGGDSIKVSF
ncbi:MAG: prepilin-type N-terminal cleavage/methylation domain-containing protein [Candidatus Zixiibacteriota bacterium]|nr:MAG: prepilin-type N-terminal cleavage/methylation domain-containing protein [candidate division Zixibacteria bacterium]